MEPVWQHSRESWTRNEIVELINKAGAVLLATLMRSLFQTLLVRLSNTRTMENGVTKRARMMNIVTNFIMH